MPGDQPRPLCFVLMPFGLKPEIGGRPIDFDAIYHESIAPSIEAAGLEPVRGHQDLTAAVVHPSILEQFLLCDYAVVDVTTARAPVFYQLGVRHGMRPHSTVLLYAEGAQLPFDVTPLHALSYRLDAAGKPDTAGFRSRLSATLQAIRNLSTDSPVHRLIDGIQASEVAHAKTDVFRERVHYSDAIKQRLKLARSKGPAAVEAIESELRDVADQEAGVLIDLLLSYRAVRQWDRMISLTGRMPPPLRETTMVQEQLAFALNRAGHGEEAERVLLQVLKKYGSSSETYSLLGRVYKDRWEAALRDGKAEVAQGLLGQAVEAYLHGFESDWRDAYPGINAVTLMELCQPPDARRVDLIPVVRYAMERKIAAGKPDYWDYATRLELAVLAKDESRAVAALQEALRAIREKWEPETTARNLRLIREARAARGETGEPISWTDRIEQELAHAAA